MRPGTVLGVILSFVIGGVALAQNGARVSPDGLWTLIDNAPAERAGSEAWVRPPLAQHLMLNAPAMQRTLEAAPYEFTQRAITTPLILALPMPDGTFTRFSVVETGVMAPELAAAFPQIKAYAGQGIDDPAATVRLDFSPLGFSAMVLAPSGDVFIERWSKGDTEHLTSAYKRDYFKQREPWSCLAEELAENAGFAERMNERYGRPGSEAGERAATGLRTYRLACAATGEYTAFHGGTVNLGQAAVVTAVNRVTGVYEKELGIRLQLVANNSSLIYTNSSTDPYTNNNGGTMLTQNQSNIDTVIGSSNYDIGHVFSTGGGGVAGLGVVCSAGNKARGVTGSGSPIGDAYWIDYVAHEMGHQFGGAHTFNTSNANCVGQRSASSAYEPGSGSTIMAYAGICGADDLQPNSDAYFHFRSLEQINSYVSGGGNCRTSVANGNNTPSVTATGAFVIPANTPFALSATGSDIDGNAITYCWEERDLGSSRALSQGDGGTGPIIRSFNPTTSNVRTVPRLSTLLGGAAAAGEILPTTTRTLAWRCTVRDNVASGGGTGFADISISVTSAAGPFTVTSQNSGGSFVATLPVTWNVAGTTANGINCANVKISLSTDGGFTFPTVLAASTPNDGAENVAIPGSVNSSTCRVKVEGVGNIFFDINNVNFSATPFPPPGAFTLVSPANGAGGVSTTPTLSWTPSTNAASYTVIVDTDFTLTPPHTFTTTTASTSVAIPAATLANSTQYYWRVTADNGIQTAGTPNPAIFATASTPACPGDLSGDSAVDTVDLVIFLGQFGQLVAPGSGADFSGDGVINTVDLVIFLGVFGTAC